MPENCIYSFKTSSSSRQLLVPGGEPWKNPGRSAKITLLWNGKKPSPAAGEIGASVSSLWNSESIFFHFNCRNPKLFVNRDYPADRSVEGLWDYDVAEVFLKPGGGSGYLEYEVSPLSQYLAAHIIKPWEKVDFSWDSKMKARAQLDQGNTRWQAVIELPFSAMSAAEPFENPVAGDIWRVNMFLALGEEPERHYMCWQPTLTADPNFHVPDAFGCLIFKD